MSENMRQDQKQVQAQSDASSLAQEQDKLQNQAAMPKDLSIEEAFLQLRTILQKMDEEGVTLEETFSCYERGMKLIRYCNSTIDRVEKKVQKLSAEGIADEF